MTVSSHRVYHSSQYAVAGILQTPSVFTQLSVYAGLSIHVPCPSVDLFWFDNTREEFIWTLGTGISARNSVRKADRFRELDVLLMSMVVVVYDLESQLWHCST